MIGVVLEQAVQIIWELEGYSRTAYLPRALETSQEHARGGGFVASLPTWLKPAPLLHLTTKYSGKGQFRGKQGNWVLILHSGVEGGGLLNPGSIEQAIHAGLTKTGGADITKIFPGKNVFADLLQGGLPDGSSLPILSYEDVEEGMAAICLHKFLRFGIALPERDIPKSGFYRPYDLPYNKLFVARMGNVSTAYNYSRIA